MSDVRGSRYDDSFVLNMSSAAKIERIVDKVRALAGERFSDAWFEKDWFRHIAVSPEWESEPDKVLETISRLPFFPFKVLLITGTAGAGKTSSIQTLAANLNCVITGSTVIASQNLSTILNRTRSAQIRTIYRVFGFNSKHVSMVDGSSQSLKLSLSGQSRYSKIHASQLKDLASYWPVIRDIVTKCTASGDKKVSHDTSELCESNIIVIDECGLLLRHMLHVVVFFYYFYNFLYDTRLCKERLIPCIVCVGSPTQTEALETSYATRNVCKSVRRGVDVLSALISDAVLIDYCNTYDNWIMFINNKRCVNLDFSDLLKHIEFGLPLRPEHVEYVDRFVRPPGLIRDPSHALDMTRLFISHAEVQRYFKRLHDRLRVVDSDKLFELPVYCVVNNKSFNDFCDASDMPPGSRRPEVWFRNNLMRIMNYSQFVDHNISDDIRVERLTSMSADPNAWSDWDDDESEETLLTTRITYIRDSSIGVNAKVRSCVIGYSGTFQEFVEILQRDTFIDRTPCEQAIHAYSLLTGLLYSGMYLYYTSEFINTEILLELSDMYLPPLASHEVQEPSVAQTIERPAKSYPTEDVHNIPCMDENSSDYVWEGTISDAEMCGSSDICFDKFFNVYAKPPPASCLSFEDVVNMYTVFKDIFIGRFKIMQRHTDGKFGKTGMIVYNRRNVFKKRGCEISSETGSFVGMLSHASPVNSYMLQGFTKADIVTMAHENKKIHPDIIKRGLCRPVVRDPVGFISVLDLNVSKFVDTVDGKSLHICTTVDYGINSRTAMTIAKSQGLSLEKVAVDFGDNPRNLRLSQIYVAISRVTDPDKLIMNLNPMRIKYEKNTYITPYICKALKNRATTLIF
ncbi:B105 [miniopterid betaherpesvirus 1]|uniref:B105 n=1 Tax=miniopterid betaherpesvirus 1 TaxID=3070189 RepID=I3VQ99_9BETA|nr:B105 [miniopterid betaherpesvirus 1]AFK83943.1 B105 [miniopterid betaherpesvirus 1]